MRLTPAAHATSSACPSAVLGPLTRPRSIRGRRPGGRRALTVPHVLRLYASWALRRPSNIVDHRGHRDDRRRASQQNDMAMKRDQCSYVEPVRTSSRKLGSTSRPPPTSRRGGTSQGSQFEKNQSSGFRLLRLPSTSREGDRHHPPGQIAGAQEQARQGPRQVADHEPVDHPFLHGVMTEIVCRRREHERHGQGQPETAQDCQGTRGTIEERGVEDSPEEPQPIFAGWSFDSPSRS